MSVEHVIAEALANLAKPTCGDVRRAADVLLRHPAASHISWRSWRSAVVGAVDRRGPRCRALWYLLDVLLKQAPLLYSPLCSTTEFEHFCMHHMPWDSPDTLDVEWLVALVRTWENVVGRTVWQALQQHGATLQARLVMRGARLGFQADGEGAVVMAAKKDLDALQESTEVLLSLIASLQQKHLRAAAERHAVERPHVEAALREGPSRDADAPPPANAASDDDEYEPVFVEGGAVRERPAEAAIKKEPRKRTRARVDDDE